VIESGKSLLTSLVDGYKRRLFRSVCFSRPRTRKTNTHVDDSLTPLRESAIFTSIAEARAMCGAFCNGDTPRRESKALSSPRSVFIDVGRHY
jgi:hypothetical protein